MQALQSHTESSTDTLDLELAKIDDLDDVKTWIAATDARNEERHLNQQQHNKDSNKRTAIMEKRVSTVEKRIILLSAAAAAGGGVIGQMMQGLFSG